jgi:hypothetical protein
MSRNLALAVLSLFLCSGAAWAAGAAWTDDVQVGNWKINLSKSHFNTSPPPKSQTIAIVPLGKDGVKVTVDAVTAKGEKSTIEYAGQYDGKENPRTESGAGAVPGQTVSLKRIDAHTAERTTYLKGKKLVTEKWDISADGKMRTVTQSGVDPAGKPVDNVVVYDKQ